MSFVARIAKLSLALGVYPALRSAYHAVSPPIRRERSLRKTFYSDFVAPGSLCFDIGANVGQTIESLSDCGARVIALEPNPACLPTLRWQFGRAANVTLVDKAVGSAPGEVVLHTAGTDSRASMREDWFEGLADTVRVQLTTLDDLIREHGTPHYCKVDVEGYEVEVFRGLTRPIPVISFELHAKELAAAESVLEMLQRIDAGCDARLADATYTQWLWPSWLAPAAARQRLRSECPNLCNLLVRMPSARPQRG